jgi:DNA-binding NarL/FixJ family response regulator
MHFPGSRSLKDSCRCLFHLPYTRIFTKPDQIQPGNSGQDGPPVVLPKRQLQVLLLICDGLTRKEIAQRMSISPKTVEFHRAVI